MPKTMCTRDTGACLTNSTWSYKVPGVGCVPERLTVSMLQDSPLLVQVRGHTCSLSACCHLKVALLSYALLS